VEADVELANSWIKNGKNEKIGTNLLHKEKKDEKHAKKDDNGVLGNFEIKNDGSDGEPKKR
jgi:hypothetical protein